MAVDYELQDRALEAEIDRMSKYGLTPQEALIYWAIGKKIVGNGNPAAIPPDLQAYNPPTKNTYVIRTGAKSSKENNWWVWNNIVPTGYLGALEKNNAPKFFIKKLNEELERQAYRVYTFGKGSKNDPYSGVRIGRVGDSFANKDKELKSLKDVITSGDVNAIIAAAEKYPKIKAVKSAATSGNITGIIDSVKALADDPLLKQAGKFMAEKLPADKIKAIVNQFGGDFITKNNIDVMALIKDPKGYVQGLAMSKGMDFAKGLLSGNSASIGGVNYALSGGSLAGTSDGEVSYKLTPDEEKVATLVYENTYKLFSPVWAKKDNPAEFWPLFKAAVMASDKSSEKWGTNKPTNTRTTPFQAAQALGIQLPSDSNISTPELIRAFALASLFTSKNRIKITDKLKQFADYNIAADNKWRALESAKKKSKIKDAIPLSTDKAMKLFDPFGLMSKKIKKVPISQTPSASDSIKQEVVDTYDEPVDEYVEPVQEDPAPVVDDTLVVMQDTKKDEEEKPSKVIPITLGVLALGGLAYLYFSNQSSSKKYYK